MTIRITYRRVQVCLDAHEIEAVVPEQYLHDLATGARQQANN